MRTEAGYRVVARDDVGRRNYELEASIRNHRNQIAVPHDEGRSRAEMQVDARREVDRQIHRRWQLRPRIEQVVVLPISIEIKGMGPVQTKRRCSRRECVARQIQIEGLHRELNIGVEPQIECAAQRHVAHLQRRPAPTIHQRRGALQRRQRQLSRHADVRHVLHVHAQARNRQREARELPIGQQRPRARAVHIGRHAALNQRKLRRARQAHIAKRQDHVVQCDVVEILVGRFDPELRIVGVGARARERAHHAQLQARGKVDRQIHRRR